MHLLNHSLPKLICKEFRLKFLLNATIERQGPTIPIVIDCDNIAAILKEKDLIEVASIFLISAICYSIIKLCIKIFTFASI